MSKSRAEEEKDKMKQVAADNGIENPVAIRSGLFSLLFIAGVPVTSYITKPDGFVQKLAEAVITLIPGGSSITSDRIIPALACIYVYWTFGGSGAFSVAGQAMSRREGLDNNHPRQNQANMRGLPLRMFSAHTNLMENFPAFAMAAALTQFLAPRNQQLINLLGFHVLAKCFVHYPAYLANIAPARSSAHILGNAAVINVLYRLALGAT